MQRREGVDLETEEKKPRQVVKTSFGCCSKGSSGVDAITRKGSDYRLSIPPPNFQELGLPDIAF